MNKQNNKKIITGFSLFLEHILPYGKIEEKGRMRQAPIVQLGGCSFNVAKTLLALGIDQKSLTLAAFSGQNDSCIMPVMNNLLDKEKFSIVLFSVKERPASSYYLLPSAGKTWAFGDAGGTMKKLSSSQKILLTQSAKENDLKILCETSADMAEIEMAKVFLKKYNVSQRSIFMPSLELIRSKKYHELLPMIDLLALNEEEAKAFFGSPPTEEDVLKTGIPYILITRGSKESWLKAGDLIHHYKPRAIKNAAFIGGAGDATLAALAYNLFIKNKSAEESLAEASTIGTETLFLATSYWQK